jgi:PHD/YefM family antitoxin component YafN of YafNO toxin-antitoxin module
MVSLQSIHALDHFKRNAAAFRERLKETGEPEVLTVDGRAEIVVQSAEGYQRLLDRLEELETVAGLREGMRDAEAGRTKPARGVFATLRRANRGAGRTSRSRSARRA